MKQRNAAIGATLVAVVTVVAGVFTVLGYFKVDGSTETGKEVVAEDESVSAKSKGDATVQTVSGGNAAQSTDGSKAAVQENQGSNNQNFNDIRTEGDFIVNPPLQESNEPRVQKASDSMPSGLVFKTAAEVSGGLVVYVRNQPENPLLKFGVINYEVATPRSEYFSADYLYVGSLSATGRMQRVVEGSQPVVESFEAVVTKFLPIGEVVPAMAGMEGLAALEAAFLLEKKSTSLPWRYEPTYCRYAEQGQEELPEFEKGSGYFPKVVTDDNVTLVRAWFAGANPGIYWVNCEVKVQDGAQPNGTQVFQLMEEPVPLAFLPSNRDGDPDLDGISLSSDWVRLPKE